MTTIKAIILTEPVAKGRPRLAVVNGHGRAYTPAKTRTAEQEIQWLIREQLCAADGSGENHAQIFPIDVPLRLTATFYRTRPRSAPKCITMPIQRPDLDNYLKLLLDALNKYVVPDDAQVTSMIISKRFATFGEMPRIELEITEDKEV